MTRVAERLVVAGVGLIGGSLALAARAAGVVGEVVGLGRSAANMEVARARGIVDRVAHDPADAIRDADLVVLAAPVGACATLAAAFRPYARAGAVLTDVGSVKADLVAAMENAWIDPALVVGGHPIAGSEAGGAGAARADLFRDRRCVLTPTARTDAGARARVRALWEAVGARVEEMSPVRHDEILARVSHLPHAIAYALMAALAEPPGDTGPVLDYAGTGLRDTTRIAASPVELWRDVFLANAPALRTALAEFRTALDRLEIAVAGGDAAAVEEALAGARAARVRLADGDA